MQKLKTIPTFLFAVLVTICVTFLVCQYLPYTGVQAQTGDIGYPAPEETPQSVTVDSTTTLGSETSSAYPAPGEDSESQASKEDYSAWDSVVISILGDPKTPKKFGNFKRLPEPVITWDKGKKERIQNPKSKTFSLTKGEVEQLNTKKAWSKVVGF